MAGESNGNVTRDGRRHVTLKGPGHKYIDIALDGL